MTANVPTLFFNTVLLVRGADVAVEPTRTPSDAVYVGRVSAAERGSRRQPRGGGESNLDANWSKLARVIGGWGGRLTAPAG